MPVWLKTPLSVKYTQKKIFLHINSQILRGKLRCNLRPTYSRMEEQLKIANVATTARIYSWFLEIPWGLNLNSPTCNCFFKYIKRVRTFVFAS